MGCGRGLVNSTRGLLSPYTRRGCGRPGKEGPVANERTADVQPSRCRPDPGCRIRRCPDPDALAGASGSDGGCGRTQDDRRADQQAIFVGADRAQRQGRPPGRRQADPRRRAADRDLVHQPPGPHGRPHGDAGDGRDLAHRQLRQGPAQRHGLGVQQGRLVGRRRRGRAEGGQARGREAHLRRPGAGRQPGQGRWAGLGVHRHAVVGRGLQRLQLLRHQPDHRRRDARHRRSARHQHVQRLVEPLAHPSLRAAAARATAPRSARRRRPSSIRAIQQRYNQPTCGRPPLLPCY